MFFVKIFLKTTRSHANLNKENNFISCKAKYKKLRDNFPTHFKVTTKHRKRRQFSRKYFLERDVLRPQHFHSKS